MHPSHDRAASSQWVETSLRRSTSAFDADYTLESIRELEEQHEQGQIETQTYLVKKQALVRLFLKSSTGQK